MHNIDMTNDRANIAFLGSRSSIWHRLGQEMKPGMGVAEWAKQAGLDWSAILVPAIPDLHGAQFDHIAPCDRMMPVEGRKHIVRSDNAHALGYVSDRYQPVQPLETLEWAQRYVEADPEQRFQIDVAGSLKHGEIIWVTATYKDPLVIGGDKHVARLLMTTTFDGTGSTINRGCMTRTVCNNTLDVALAEKGAIVRTRHSTRFDAARVGKELGSVAAGFAAYKAMGDAMAATEIGREDVAKLFKHCLDIPFDQKSEDTSTRKQNQFKELSSSYRATVAEGTAPDTVWAALNAITRYVDHDKSVKRNGSSEDEKRFTSAQFGSGAQMKAKAVQFLMPRIADRVLVDV